MALYRSISMSFWTDSKIVDDFTPEDRYFYLYLFSNPHTNLCGCYEISKKQISNETGYSVETVSKLLERFERVHNVIRYSSETKEVILLNWHKHNWTSSEKHQQAVRSEISHIKNKSFQEYLLGVLGESDTVSIPYTYGMDTTITNTITNTNSNSSTKDRDTVSKPKRFTPPTVDDVRAYCEERKNNVDPDRFVDFYASKGWKVGNQSMKDWKAAVRNWEHDDRGRASPKKNSFTDFDQRVYDYDELERRLTGVY